MSDEERKRDLEMARALIDGVRAGYTTPRIIADALAAARAEATGSAPGAVERFLAHPRCLELVRDIGDGDWSASWLGNADCIKFGATPEAACEAALKAMEAGDGKT